MRRFRLAIIFFCALGLLWGQHAAYAHGLSHVAGAAKVSFAPEGKSVAPEICADCAAFAGLTSAPPAVLPPIALAQGIGAPAPAIPRAEPPTASAPPYASRAPPVFQA